MPAINYTEVRRCVELDGIDRTVDNLSEALRDKQLKPEDFSFKSLFETLVTNEAGDIVGKDVLSECFDPRGPKKSVSVMEAAGAVTTANFQSIMGQVIYNKLLDRYNAEEFVFSKLIPTVPTSLQSDRIAGVSDIGDQAQIVEEGGAYPIAGVNENFIDTPQTVKRGVIVPVTKEAVFFDRTGLVLDRAGRVGYALGLNKEKRLIDVTVDENTTAGRYRWRNASYATYQTSTPWINKKTSNALTDWSNIDAVEQLFANMTDPDTAEPIMIVADTLIVCPQLFNAASRNMNATQIVLQAGGFATTGSLFRTAAPNPVGAAGNQFSNAYKIVTSRLIPTRTATDTDWFLGSPSQAFAYMENWPITVSQAPVNSEEEFQRDIVWRFKASERGAAATIDPRLMCKSST